MDRNVLNLSFEVANTSAKRMQVLNFLKQHFFLDEPIVEASKLYEDEQGLKELENYTKALIDDDLSLIVSDLTSKEIAGVAVISVKYKNQSKSVQKIKSKKFERVAKFLEHLENEAKTFQRIDNLEKAISLDMLSVNPNYRGKGLAKIMIEKVINFAKEKGFKLIRIDCTSLFSTKAALNLGFESVYRIKYAEYKDDGEIVFKINENHPHQEANAMLQIINI
nr:dopamine N-acetyltransferase-like [Onthophagus taurus]